MYRDTVLALSPIAYWMLAEASGLTAECEVNSAQDGTYYGATLGEPALVEGYTSAYFPGGDPGPSESSCDIYSATLASAFDGNVGSLIGWFKWNGDVLDENPQRLIWMRAAGGTYLTVAIDDDDGLHAYVNPTLSDQFNIADPPDSEMHMVSVTWDASGGGVAYLDGAEIDTDTQDGTWTGVLNQYTCVLGSDYFDGDSFANFTGWLAHWALWDRVLTPTEVANLYNAGTGYLAGAVGTSLCRLGTPSDEIDEYVYGLLDLMRDSYWRYPT